MNRPDWGRGYSTSLFVPLDVQSLPSWPQTKMARRKSDSEEAIYIFREGCFFLGLDKRPRLCEFEGEGLGIAAPGN